MEPNVGLEAPGGPLAPPRGTKEPFGSPRVPFWLIWGSFGVIFGNFFGTLRYLRYVSKTMLPWRRELDFQGPGVHQLIKKAKKNATYFRKVFGRLF